MEERHALRTRGHVDTEHLSQREVDTQQDKKRTFTMSLMREYLNIQSRVMLSFSRMS